MVKNINPQLRLTAAAMLVCAGCASSTSPLTKWDIPRDAERVLVTHQEKFRECYRRHAGLKDPRLRGVVMVFFRLSPQGKVMNASVRDTSLMDPATEVCIVRELKKIEFGVQEHPSTNEITYPVRFSGYE